MVVGGKPVKDEADQNIQNTQVQDQADAGDGDLGLVEDEDQNGEARGSGDTRGIGDTRGSGDTR